MNRKSIIKAAIVTLLSVIFSIACQAQSPEGCFSSDGKFKACGSSWDDYYNGVAYRCTCNCSTIPPAQCSPKSSSSSSSSSGGGGGYSPQAQMAHDLLQPLVTNFFKWLMSPSPRQSQQNNSAIDKKRQEELDREYKQRQEEYKAMMLAQISNAKSEFERQNKLNHDEQLKSAVNEFKDRLAKSEAAKVVKQANCAAFTSLQAAKTDLSNLSNFKDLDGPAEKARNLADFPSVNKNGCPEIKIEIPEVNATQPVSLQEMFYNYVVHQADSIKSTVDTLKVRKTKNDQAIVEKKQKIEEVKLVIEKQKRENKPADTVNNPGDDQLTKDALKELEAATNELQTAEENDKKMKNEIAEKEKNITALEKMRSTYDTDQKQSSPIQSSNK